MDNPLKTLERVKGIGPSSSAWKTYEKANEINGSFQLFAGPKTNLFGPKELNERLSGGNETKE
jgi:hypothetical protein